MAGSWYTCIQLLLLFKKRRMAIDPPQKDCSTAGQEPNMSCESYDNFKKGEKKKEKRLWGE